MKRRVLLVFGTRPEAIKMAPVVEECRQRADDIEPIVCLTGQHREMLDQVTQYFDIRSDIDLDLMVADQSLATLTASCMAAIERTLLEVQPDCVVAQGDTTTAMVTSMAAFYRQIPFVHVEAGLRTGNLESPWPRNSIGESSVFARPCIVLRHSGQRTICWQKVYAKRRFT